MRPTSKSSKRVRVARVLAVLASLSCVAAVHAQGSSGLAQVTGLVTYRGEPVEGAILVLQDLATEAERTTQSMDGAAFMFDGVLPGVYRLTATHDALGSAEISARRIEVGQRAVFDIELQGAGETTIVDVTAVGPLTDRESSAGRDVVDSGLVQDAPIDQRGFLGFTKILGGAVDASGRSDPTAQTGHPERAVAIGGAIKAAYVDYQYDGIQLRGSRSGELAANVSIANVDQFVMQTGFFLPDQGPGAAQVNVVTKAGANEFHGEVFDFLRNTRLDARSFFAAEPEDLKRNQFGAFVGGPLLKQRAFFYAGYEGLREVSAPARGARVPTERMFRGDFSEIPRVIYDPASSGSVVGRTPFPNNTIPDSRIPGTSRKLLDFYTPATSLAQLPNNLLTTPRRVADGDQVSLRLDIPGDAHHHIYGQFLYYRNPALEQGLFPLSGRNYPNEAQLASIRYLHTPSKPFVHMLRIGFVRNAAKNYNLARNQPGLARSLGIVNTPDDRGVPLQYFLAREYADFGNSGGDLGNTDNSYQLDESLTRLKGRHEFKAGFTLRHHRTWQTNANLDAVGILAYKANYTADYVDGDNGSPTTDGLSGDSFADLMLGMPTALRLQSLPTIPYRHTQFAPYFQDTWRLHRRLTMSYGLAWFLHGRPDPQGSGRDFSHSFDYERGLLTYAALGELDPKVVQPDRNNFAPRLGLAWRAPDDRTVVRAGAGLYYADQQQIHLQFGAVAPPLAPRFLVFQGFPATFTFQQGNVFPEISQPELSASSAENVDNGASFLLRADKAPTTSAGMWTLSIQRQLTENDLVDLIYLGQSSHHLQNQYDFNQCRVGPDLFCGSRPYRYGEVILSEHNGNASYNSFQTRYVYRRSSLNLRLAYVWSKALTDSWESQGISNSMIANNRALDKDHSAFDVRHRAVLTAVWNVGFKAGLWKSGWTLSTIADFATGTPILLSTPPTTSNLTTDHRPNRLCSGELPGSARSNDLRVLDPTCFATPALGFFGNSSRNPLHGPGSSNWDIAIMKRFPLSETAGLQVRADFLNAFNRAQFENPSGNVANPNFGRIFSSRRGRVIQLALKLLF